MNATPPRSLRLFYALWPDPATRTALLGLQQRVSGRPVAYNNLHLTLAFLGEQPADRSQTLDAVLRHLPPFELTLAIDRVSYFTRQQIAWAGMSCVPEPLLSLQSELLQALQHHGMDLEARGFRPHITLARNAPPPPDMAFETIIWKVEEIALVKSVTDPRGAQYDILSSRPLGHSGISTHAKDGESRLL